MTAALAVAVTVVAGGCSTTSTPDDAGAAPSRSTTTTAAPRPTAIVDEPVSIDTGKLHLHCEGAGATTVVLIAGWGDGGDESWSTVQPELAQQTRVCTYDRYGTGTSDPPAGVQTFGTQAADLGSLLDAAGEPGPYVVAGHSFGGPEAVMFTAGHRDDVVGLLLLDASPTTWPAAVCAVPDDGSDATRGFGTLCEIFGDPSRDTEQLDVPAAFEEVAAIDTLGDIPITVITAATRTAPGLAPASLAELNRIWAAGVERWATLSEHSSVVSVRSGHYIQLEHPDVVIDELAELIPKRG